jgi:hypothetical protein
MKGKPMDTGEGRFEKISGSIEVERLNQLADMVKKYPKSKGVFAVGEELEIKGSRFRVAKIDQLGIRLRLLKTE